MSLICHIGYPKTGSTYLQKSYFPQLLDIHYMSWNKELLDTFNKIINYDDSFYEVSECQKILQKNSLKESNLFSFEPFTGSHHNSRFSNRTQIARRLKELGVSKIIITIRNQFDILNSSYKQYIRNGGVLKIDDYLGLKPQREHSMLDKTYFDYYTIYKLYVELFGNTNVLLLQYENMNTKVYIDKLNKFVGNTKIGEVKKERVHASISASKSNILRWFNHFSYSTHRPSSLISKRISSELFNRILRKIPYQGSISYMNERRREVIANFYKESNQLLINNYKIDLDSRYPL